MVWIGTVCGNQPTTSVPKFLEQLFMFARSKGRLGYLSGICRPGVEIFYSQDYCDHVTSVTPMQQILILKIAE